MIVKNISQKTIVSDNIKVAKTFLDQTLGLLKSNTDSLLLKTRFGIHTFGLDRAIDIIILSDNFAVVKYSIVKPNSIFIWNPKYFLVLELPAGSIKKSKTTIGDILKVYI